MSIFKELLDGTGEREASTTMSFVRLLSILTKDKSIGKHVVPIVPDEARTFGMDPCLDSLVYTHIQDSCMIPLIQISFYITKKKRTDKFLRKA